jgi:hypothetical protein
MEGLPDVEFCLAGTAAAFFRKQGDNAHIDGGNFAVAVDTRF